MLREKLLREPLKYKIMEGITLGEIFERTQGEFPDFQHDFEAFKDKIIEVLKQDPLRTLSERRKIEERGRVYIIPRVSPINDFLEGQKQYLKNKDALKKNLMTLGENIRII